MSLFPGNVLIIDDQFDIVYKDEPTDTDKKIQYNSFIDIKKVCDDHGIPLISISDISDIEVLLKRIERYSNVRLLILDLDLNESGDVEEDDEILVRKIVLHSIKSFGYFFLLINSSYSEKWEDIKKALPEDLHCQKVITNLCDAYNKKDNNLQDKILDLLTSKYSIEIISQFEAKLNEAKDKVLGNFIDFSKSTWESVSYNLRQDFDSKSHLNYTITQYLLGLIKQFLINVSYSEIEDVTHEHDKDLLKEITIGFNYLTNKEGHLNSHPIWTGNLYKCDNNNVDRKYLVVITPECDIAQSKTSSYKILYGFEVNEITFPDDYSPDQFNGTTPPPVLIRKAGKDKNDKWKKRKDINDNPKNISQSLYFLPFASENGKHIFLDFRDSSTVDDLNHPKYSLLSRINEPLITDITDKYSAIYNRKGLPNFLPKKLKIDE